MDQLLHRKACITGVMQEVEKIISDVRERGDDAMRDYTKEFDGIELESIKVDDGEIESAMGKVEPDLIKEMEFAADFIRRFHYRQKGKNFWLDEFSPGIYLGQKTVPLSTVGAYVPRSYFSTALMTVIPAKVAGVPHITLCTPPDRNGTVNPLTLVAARIAGADEMFKIGGPQAIAGMAVGTQTIKKVDKIVGPGNVYVTTAKLLIRNEVEVDLPAGPSEIVILADEHANPKIVAADMLAQLEHARSSAILITPSEKLAVLVKTAGKDGLILIVEDIRRAIKFINSYAPEHLEIMVKKPLNVIKEIRNAGSIFIGEYAPVAAGDYVLGNHVLPTAGYAKNFSGLNVNHFTKKMTIQLVKKEGLARIKDTTISLSEAEGFRLHAKSIETRF